MPYYTCKYKTSKVYILNKLKFIWNHYLPHIYYFIDEYKRWRIRFVGPTKNLKLYWSTRISQNWNFVSFIYTPFNTPDYRNIGHKAQNELLSHTYWKEPKVTRSQFLRKDKCRTHQLHTQKFKHKPQIRLCVPSFIYLILNIYIAFIFYKHSKSQFILNIYNTTHLMQKV